MFPEIKKKLGFGCMRLPLNEDKTVKEEIFSKMIANFLEQGFNYFDTAHGYLNGQSEIALSHCLTSKYPRDAYVLADKLTDEYFNCEEDVRPFIQSQLDLLGIEYFDFYLMHALGKRNYDKFQRCHAFEIAYQMKKEGKIKHLGFSFHDSPDTLETILNDHPEVEFVQIQFNYFDYEDPNVASRACYEILASRGIPNVVMEPVKGGRLANLPKPAEEVLNNLHGGSPASYAIRFAASFPNTMVVLSGMSDLEQMEDNLSYMKEFKPLDEKEMNAIKEVNSEIKKLNLIQCTSCHYCTASCPRQIPIPDIFASLNSREIFQDWGAGMYYRIRTANTGKASDCIKCGRCEHSCPQHLPIRELLEKATAAFEKRKEE